MTLVIVFGLASGAMAYGGNGGGNAASTSSSGTNDPPDGFVPINLDPLPMDQTLVTEDLTDTSSVEQTEITILNEDDIGQDVIDNMGAILVDLMNDPNVQWIAITTGGIIIGYATAGAGLPVYAQAIAAGTWAATTTYYTKNGDPGSTAYSGGKDFVVGFVPVPPPAQAAISWGTDKTGEIVSQAPSLNSRGTGSGGYTQTYAK